MDMDTGSWSTFGTIYNHFFFYIYFLNNLIQI